MSMLDVVKLFENPLVFLQKHFDRIRKIGINYSAWDRWIILIFVPQLISELEKHKLLNIYMDEMSVVKICFIVLLYVIHFR